MFEFYEFNTINICVVFVSILLIYTILIKCNKDSEEKEDKNKFYVEYLIIASIIGFIISLIIAYYLTGKEEELLKYGFWESNQEN